MHICVEGLDGTGKTTLSNSLVNYYQNLGYSVFKTSEPGHQNQECSMDLRNLILNKKYENDIDTLSREYLLATSRRIQFKKSQQQLEVGKIVIQDRGWLSGLVYGMANGSSQSELIKINKSLNPNFFNMFDFIIYLNNNGEVDTLELAKNAKKEFDSGDIIESKGQEFQMIVKDNFNKLISTYKNKCNIIIVNLFENGKRLTTEELVYKVVKRIKKKVVFILGKSGSGKSTLEKYLEQKNCHRIISYTTRIKRENEQNGNHYNFVNKEEFQNKLKNKEFIQNTFYQNEYYAVDKNTFRNKDKTYIYTISPDSIEQVKKNLDSNFYEFINIVFDISDELIRKNLLKDYTEEEIEKRLKRPNYEDSLKQVKKDFIINDKDLNETLNRKVLKFIKEQNEK